MRAKACRMTEGSNELRLNVCCGDAACKIGCLRLGALWIPGERREANHVRANLLLPILATALLPGGRGPTFAEPSWRLGPRLISMNWSSCTAIFMRIPSCRFRDETAARVAKELRAAGVEVTEGVGRTGVVGVLKNGGGPTVMVRTDLDALPVTEQTGLAYASQGEGEGRGGRDRRDARLRPRHPHDQSGRHGPLVRGPQGPLARARSSSSASRPKSAVGGAKAMLDDGLFTRFPKPDYALALHCDSQLGHGQGRRPRRLCAGQRR